MDAQHLKENAELSMASYADLSIGSLVGQKDTLKRRKLSDVQAIQFAERYKVAVSTYNDPITSFSATVFENKANGELTLAIRGSDVRDWITTNPDVFWRGAAYGQIVEMYNWWSRITSPEGANVPQYAISRYPELGDGPASPSATLIFSNHSGGFKFDYYLELTSNASGTGELLERTDERLTVTGHSLGGHLAMAFGSIFPGVTEDIVVFNAPGFIDNAPNRVFFQALNDAAVPNGVATTNIVSDTSVQSTEDWSLIAGLHSRPGLKSDLVIENQLSISEPYPDIPSLNHSIQQLADSLGIYNLLNQLDPALTTAKYQTIFQLASNEEYQTLERILDSLSSLLGSRSPFLPEGNNHRDELYQSIYSLQENSNFQALIDADVSIEAASPAVDPRSDFGAFLALVNLSPMVIRANDAAGEAALMNANRDMASAWLEDQNLGDAARSYTDQYLDDRSLMRSTLIAMNNGDDTHGQLSQKVKFTNLAPNSSDNQVFDGDANGYPDTPNSWPQMFDPERARYVFGSDVSEDASDIVASNSNDHLYGMGGDDLIEGLDGSDNIEGGDGDDELRGGDAGDVLVGGQGGDTLQGGEDVDYLIGGAGADKFKWFSGDGDDVIGDYDDAGDRIYVNDIDLATLDFKRVSADSPYYIDSSQPDVKLHYDGDFLTISAGTGQDAGSISVTQYLPATGSNYGIVLGDPADAPPPISAYTVLALGSDGADEIMPYVLDRKIANQLGMDWYATSIMFDATTVRNYTGGSFHGTYQGYFEGGPVDDALRGDDSQNALNGLAGNDVVDGGGGDDSLEGWAGSDRISGGDGSDLISGSAWADTVTEYEAVVLSSGDRFQVYIPQIKDGESDVNILSGEGGDDFITGGEFTDYIDGGLGSDYLFGGTGGDIISGAADTDIIYGDSTFRHRVIAAENNSYAEVIDIAFAAGNDDVGQYDDVIHAGSGDDIIWGELGDDEIFGESGDDFLVGDRYHDVNYFNHEWAAYSDTLPDLSSSLHGNDRLYGGAGNDRIMGLAGNDWLAGGTGTDWLEGGAGDDTYSFSRGDGLDSITDTAGTHTLVFSGISHSELNIMFKGSQVYVGVGFSEGFSIAKSAWNNVRIALDTPDRLIERSQLDHQYFNSTGDLLLTLNGTDTLSEADRDEVVSVDTSNPDKPRVVVGEGATEVAIQANPVPTEAARMTIIANTQELFLELLDFQLSDTQDYLALLDGMPLNLIGFSGDILGTPGADKIIGSESVDTIDGRDGNDILEGRGGNDELIGGFGNDILRGEAGNDKIRGGMGDDALHGGSGGDELIGETGNDRMFGGDGDDVLRGGPLWLEVDYFNGGGGSDTFIGGPGPDVYAFAHGDGQDLLSDSGAHHFFEFAAGVDPSLVVLYYTDDTDSRVRLEYGPGDVITTQDDFSAYWINGLEVDGVDIPLVQRSDLLDGTFHDTLWHDVFDTGSGNDTIYARGMGNDVYLFSKGDEHDTVKFGADLINSSQKGEIRFAADVDLDAIAYNFLGANAKITYGSGDEITLETSGVTSWRDNSLVRFTLASEADPNWIPVIRTQNITGFTYGSYGADRIIGSDSADVIIPGYGNDIIEAGDGMDRIVLNDLYMQYEENGIGHKVILGQGGDDIIQAPLYQGLTFQYNTGDGHDTIEYDWTYTSYHPYSFSVDWEARTAAFHPEGEDTLAFGEGITLADLRFTRFGDILGISMTDGSGSVSIDGFFHAWDVETPTDAASALHALMYDSRYPQVDTLLDPAVLAVVPKAPIARLGFADGNTFDMASVLNAFLELSDATVVGTEADDQIYGTGEDDVIHGYGGNDYIEDFEGNNTIDAGAGDDEINVAGVNLVNAGTGDDDITATGNNVINTGAGDDDVIILAGTNVVNGGPGNDKLRLRGGDNIVQFAPGDGDDTIHFTVGTDTGTENGTAILEMAEGLTVADIRVYLVSSGDTEFVNIHLPDSDDFISLQPNIFYPDEFVYRPHPHATFTEVRFSDGTVISGDELFAMAIPPANYIEGTDGNDRIIGTPGMDDIFGGPGNDVLRGEAGDDYFLVGGQDSGNDRIIGGEGFDVIAGYDEDDTFTLVAMPLADSIELIDGAGGRNVISGTSQNNNLNFSATQLLNIARIEGGEGDDIIVGSQGDDVVVGGPGNDKLRGEGGNDTFIVTGQDQGSDRILGGEGHDTIAGGDGDDTIALSAMSAGFSIETIDGGLGANLIVGNDEDNVLNFSATQLLNISRVEGGGGHDKIRGSQGHDVLAGDAGDDVLNGLAGHDTLIGGVGDDILSGSLGDDTYVFGAGDGRDRINNNDSEIAANDSLLMTDIDYDDLWLSRQGNHLLIDVVGADAQVQVNHWYKNDEDQLDAIYAGGRVLLRNQVEQLVSAMAAFDVPTGVGAIIPQETRTQLESTLTAVWQVAA